MTKKAWIGVAVAVVAVGAVVGVNLKNRRPKGTAVDLHTVGREDVVSRVSCRGAVEAKRKVELSATVMGQIVNLAVREGDRVEKDQFLLQIDQAQLKAQATGSQAALQALLADREAARANAAQAQSDFERAEKNFRGQVIPEADFQRARSSRDSAQANLSSVERRVEQARANLEASRDSLSKTTMRAPMAGIVTALPVEEGEIAVIGTMNNAGTKLMTISDMSEVEADLEVDETDIPRVKLGQKATVKIDAFPEQSFEATVSEIGTSPIVRAGSTSQAIEFSVKVLLSQPPEGIRPGFSVTADIETGARQGVLTVPVQALVVQDLADQVKKQEKAEKEQGLAKVDKPAGGPRKDVEGVYKMVDGKAKFVPVETGLEGDLRVEVVSGLGEGDTVIQGPFRELRALKEGDPVRDKAAEQQKKKGGGGGERTAAASR